MLQKRSVEHGEQEPVVCGGRAGGEARICFEALHSGVAAKLSQAESVESMK